MSDIAIRVENLGKLYRIGKPERYKTLRDTLPMPCTRRSARWRLSSVCRRPSSVLRRLSSVVFQLLQLDPRR
jgi:hypothetical protein